MSRAKETPLRRGEEETRSHFERARDEFEAAGVDGQRIVERVDLVGDNGGCPECHEPMLLRHTYRMPDAYHFEGRCSANKAHDIERYGHWFRTEGTTLGGGVDPALFERKGDA